jgi:hypothetical protein
MDCEEAIPERGNSLQVCFEPRCREEAIEERCPHVKWDGSRYVNLPAATQLPRVLQADDGKTDIKRITMPTKTFSELSGRLPYPSSPLPPG